MLFGAASRKKEENQQRASRILAEAQRILSEEGFGALTMDRLSQRLDFSKGTIYHHFGSREDVFTALFLRSIERRNALFERAAAFSGKTRERLSAMSLAYELFMKLEPEHMAQSLLVHSESVLPKASQERQMAVMLGELRCLDVAVGIIRDAMSQGDLALRGGATPHDLSFSVWSLHFGHYRLLSSRVPSEAIGIADPFGSVRRMVQTLLDGAGWKPLSTEWDYEATLRRALDTLFVSERELFR